MLAQTETTDRPTDDITPCTYSRCEKGGGQRVGSTIFHVSKSRYYHWSRSYLEAAPLGSLLFYTIDISSIRGKVAGCTSQPGFTRSSPSLSFSIPFRLHHLFCRFHLLCFSPSLHSPAHLRGAFVPRVGTDERVPARPDSAAPSRASQNCTSARAKRKDTTTRETKKREKRKKRRQKGIRFSPLCEGEHSVD